MTAEEFSTEYRNHKSHLLWFITGRMAYRNGGFLTYPEDLAEETWVTAWQNLSKFDGTSTFFTWLRGIAENKRRSLARRHDVRFVTLCGSRPPSVKFARNIGAGVCDWDSVKELVRRKIPGRAEAVLKYFELTAVYGYSTEEAAAILGETVDGCRNLIWRTRQMVQQHHRAATKRLERRT